MEARNEGENLLLRRTQGDLLQKLRQLQQWRQEKEEHLLQDKEKQMNLLRDKERQLQAVQEYQRKILHNNNLVTSRIEGSPSFQVQPAGFHERSLSRPLLGMRPNESVMTSGSKVAVPHGINTPTRNVLLSPEHFKTRSNMNSSYVSPPMKNQNQMLLTQRLQLPLASDDELSQFTESDAASIADIEGIRPIEDTPSETSEACDDEDGIKYSSDSGNSDSGDNNSQTLVHHNDDDDNNGDSDNGDHYDGNSDGDDHNGDDIDHHDCDDSDDDIGTTNRQVIGSGPEHNVNSKPSFDDIPIKPGLGAQTKTFEELLDQQLQVEQQNKKHEETSRPKETTLARKKTFLKKGEGIARFGVRPKMEDKQPSTTTLKAKDFGNNFVEQKGGPVTRKTATVKHLATENPTAIVKQSASIKQTGLAPAKQTVKQAESIMRNGFDREAMIDHPKQPFSPKKVHFDTGQSLSHPFTDDVLEENSESRSEDGVLEEGGDIVSGNQVVIEDSFQERMNNWDDLEVVEKQELNEFELLEEAAAANCSLSSNSSTVLKFLGKKREQNRADLNNNFLGTRQQWRIAQKGAVETAAPDRDVNRTLTEENLDDDQMEKDDTLKDPEVISVRSSLALSDGFDDTKTWDDHDALDISDVTDDVVLALNTSTPEEKSQWRRSQAQKRKMVDSSTPPTSALVTKLFPQLKAKNEPRKPPANHNQPPPQQVMAQPAAPEQAARLDAGGTDRGLGMSSAVRDKLQELEKEIEKFREENVALHRLREERVKDLQELQKERELFENYKTEELERIEKFKTEEEKRLRRDKRVFEQYQKASRALPDKKERDEITILKAKINELQEDLKLRESRWSAAATRYKDRINNLEKENREMREEVKLLEKQNLDLQRKEQQKMRELQQYKAFEKKKLRKPEEIPLNRSPTNSVPQIKEHKDEDVIKEDENVTTARVGMKKQPKPASDIRPSHPTAKNIPPPDKIKTVEQVDSVETRETDHADVENASSVPASLKDHSPPTKQAGSSKSVRFKDDDIQEQEKRPETLPTQLCHSDGKREIINPDGSRVVTFANGTRKEISADGLSVVVTFFNGDIKQILPDDRVEYYYAEVQTTHTTYPDGLEVLRFPSNQIEKHYPDGTKEIIFPDQTVKYLYTSGAEECVFTEGTVERISVDGERVVEFPNGQRETYTKLFKKREYPDGTVKTVYSDGRQETRYSSGRLRVKDSEGRLLVDTAEQNTQAQQSVAS